MDQMMEHDSAWSQHSYQTLCVAYGIVSFLTLIQLIRIKLRVPEFRWTTQQMFSLMHFIFYGARAFEFGLNTAVFNAYPKVLTRVVLDLPGLFFFSAYTLLVLFWAEIYSQARSFPTDKLRTIYCLINGGMYLIQAGIWVYLWGEDYNSAFAYVNEILMAVMSITAASGFLLVGGRLFLMVKRFPIESIGRTKKLHEVGSITAICFSCFSIKCIWALVSVFYSKDASSHNVFGDWVTNFIYHTLLEILPSASTLYILRKLPPKRVQAPAPARAGHGNPSKMD